MRYTFGGDTGMTYDQLQRQRAIANAMMQQNRTPQNVGEGLSSAAQSIAGALIARKADKQDAANRDQFNANWSSVADAMMGGGASDGYGGATTPPPADASWASIRQGIFDGESGGDYDALFGHSNREGGQFAGTKLTDMTVDQALSFADPSGPYGQWVKGEVGRVATPMGAYQVVGSTLRDAKRGLGLKGDEVMSPELQEKIGQWIYQQQGTGAWEGYRGPQTPRQPSQAEVMRLVELSSSPYATEGQKAVAQAMLQRQMQESDPMRQLQMQKLQADIASTQNPPPNLTSDQRNYQFYADQEQAAGRQPLSFNEWDLQSRRAGATNVTVGGAGPELGKLSTDYGYVLDPETGMPKVDPQTGLPTAAPVPGSPAARELQATATAAEERNSQAGRAANIVMQDIDLALEQSGGFGTTGVIGSVASNIGGTEAHDLENTLRTIQANIGFDRLQQMREASPTGGALGAVSERELTELQAVLGSIKQSQSKDQLQRNLNRLKGVYGDILAKANAYPNADQFGFGGAVEGAPDASGAAPGASNPPAAPVMTQESFMADPGVIEAARSAGVTPQEMWEIYQEGRQ